MARSGAKDWVPELGTRYSSWTHMGKVSFYATWYLPWTLMGKVSFRAAWYLPWTLMGKCLFVLPGTK
jgi:hypothetical protein